MKVRANAETPADARTARDFGAEGIGLSRTEHMFFEGERIVADARDDPGRRRRRPAQAALAKLLPMQRDDFAGLFEIMTGCRSRSACSTRRCTSSCRTPTRKSPRFQGMGVPAEKLRARARRAA